MNTEQAWQTILGQLQTDMPRASFETWVQDTKLISLQDGVMTISVRNAYARDWLENRLTSTVNRLLVGILNTSDTRVKFVVNDGEDDGDIAEDDDADGNAIFAVVPEDKNHHTPENSFEIALADYDSAYEKVVRPNRAVYLPGYFRRWLRHLGPDLGWLYVAYRQAAYIAGSRTGKATNRIPGEKIASLAGIAKRTFWYRFEDERTWEKLKGLVEISDHGPQWDDKSPTPKRLPRRYTISMTLPLTPVDMNSLSKWLASHIEQWGGPEGVLRAAVEAPLDELIPLDATEAGEPVTVTKLVRELFGGGALSNELLDSLASAIQNRIMPQGDLIVVTEYFLRHILPHIGAGPGWMLTILRDACYVNPESGETRNRVKVQGGYAEIAGWMGMVRPLTIYEWLHGKKGDEFKEPILRIYTCEVPKEEKQLDFASQPRIFDVLIEEVPRELLESSLISPDYATCTIALTRFADPDYATCTIGFTRFAVSNYAICTIAFTRFAQAIYATCRVLSSLTLKPNSLNSNNTTPLNSNVENEKNDEPQNSAVVDFSCVPAAWDLEQLLKINKADPKTRRLLREVDATAEALVSWMLYATSQDSGAQGLREPFGFALSKLPVSPDEGKNSKFDTLAALPPRTLVEMLSGTDFSNHHAGLFESLMMDPARNGWHDIPRFRILLPILLGEKAVQEETRNVETIRIQTIRR